MELTPGPKHGHHRHGGPEPDPVHHEDRPFWKRAHRDWRVWIAVVFCMTAISIYVLSDDLALLPRHQVPRPQSGAVAK